MAGVVVCPVAILTVVGSVEIQPRFAGGFEIDLSLMFVSVGGVDRIEHTWAGACAATTVCCFCVALILAHGTAAYGGVVRTPIWAGVASAPQRIKYRRRRGVWCVNAS